jgi:hypothetical protein
MCLSQRQDSKHKTASQQLYRKSAVQATDVGAAVWAFSLGYLSRKNTASISTYIVFAGIVNKVISFFVGLVVQSV